mmetsp:Transcript_15130/g.28757  ORF Transcript_15130/g.28757 Transcript_15130/m.28757 type:complete len:240 (+) Transcript_15130:1080-1799(+)
MCHPGRCCWDCDSEEEVGEPSPPRRHSISAVRRRCSRHCCCCQRFVRSINFVCTSPCTPKHCRIPNCRTHSFLHHRYYSHLRRPLLCESRGRTPVHSPPINSATLPNILPVLGSYTPWRVCTSRQRPTHSIRRSRPIVRTVSLLPPPTNPPPPSPHPRLPRCATPSRNLPRRHIPPRASCNCTWRIRFRSLRRHGRWSPERPAGAGDTFLRRLGSPVGMCTLPIRSRGVLVAKAGSISG